MAWFMNQFPYSCLLCKPSRLFLSAGTGRTSLTRNSIPSKFRATVRSWIRSLAGSLRLNSPFIWLSVRTQFSLMISSRHCLISSSTNTLFRPLRGLSLLRPSLMYRATIPLAWNDLLLTCLPQTSNPLPHPQKHGLFALCVLKESYFFLAFYASIQYSRKRRTLGMNRTAQRIREIVLSRFLVYIRVCGEKNDETCRTHVKKIPSLHLFTNSCWLCNVFIWKKILAKRV